MIRQDSTFEEKTNMTLQQLFALIISNDEHHAKFLNTLSFMENTGARKISASEHPETVTTMILKHAAEEHRHAYYLKKQLGKVKAGICPTYSRKELIAPAESYFYLNKLDVYTCRYLKNELGLTGTDLRYAAYLFVTYAIELRADDLYPIYQTALSQLKSKITVKSIILEEVGHLEEMIAQLEAFSPDWGLHAAKILAIENNLFTKWISALKEEINGVG